MNVLLGANELIAKQRPTFLVEAEDRHRENAVRDVFSFFAERNYRGLFVLQDKLLGVGNFHSSMQEIDRLRADRHRRESDYINNFIFIPAERYTEHLVRAMEIALRK